MDHNLFLIMNTRKGYVTTFDNFSCQKYSGFMINFSLTICQTEASPGKNVGERKNQFFL